MGYSIKTRSWNYFFNNQMVPFSFLIIFLYYVFVVSQFAICIFIVTHSLQLLSVQRILWDSSWIKLSRFNVSFFSPPALPNGVQLTSKIAHVYSSSHFISVWWESYFLSKILARFCFFIFSNLKAMLLRVKCRQKISDNVDVIIPVVLFIFNQKCC